MLDNCKTQEELWNGVQQLITRWLAERQELVIMYSSLSGIKNFSSNSASSIKKLRLLCEVLVDYASAGHFEVYDQLLREAEAYKDGSGVLLQKLLPEITETTNFAMSFNDTYDTDEHSADALGCLKEELSLLGEHLVTRFALEDQLIQKLHNVHSVPSAIPQH